MFLIFVDLIIIIIIKQRKQRHPVKLGTADPTWGDILQSCYKVQSSKLESLFCQVSVKRDVGALSFEL